MKKNSITMRVDPSLIDEWKKYQKKIGVNISFINYTKIVAKGKSVSKKLLSDELWNW